MDSFKLTHRKGIQDSVPACPSPDWLRGGTSSQPITDKVLGTPTYQSYLPLLSLEETSELWQEEVVAILGFVCLFCFLVYGKGQLYLTDS